MYSSGDETASHMFIISQQIAITKEVLNFFLQFISKSKRSTKVLTLGNAGLSFTSVLVELHERVFFELNGPASGS